ncbi:IcIR family transcriptional regulator [Corynebacterium suranareeae]|uniref:IcIR family transcriptional regulator n=1 Tax=Corynebacterium suranareeae TaxID=2506452 RepID=A0A169SC70_9CORY|nr:IclR family transcriptional regulator C-terminal domain-containing protein [Corynebacterium suranareeae]BAU97405.1 IcIR family transcriptional regulator [Corynebacterium suranareeae]
MRTIQLLNKAGLLVNALAKGPKTHSELAKQLGEPRSSIYRITSSLEEVGLIQTNNEGQLGLGVRILHLGESAVDALVNRTLLRQNLGWLRDQLGMTAFFCTVQQDQIICLDRQEGADIDLIYLAPGRVLPSKKGAVAHVLQREGPPKSWSWDDGELASGVASVAVAVKDSSGNILGAVAVAGLSASIGNNTETIRDALRKTAVSIADMPPATTEEFDSSRINEPNSPSVIVKAATLLEVLRHEGQANSARLAEVLGEPISSVYRMLHTLTSIGWVEQDGKRGSYRIGLIMLSLAEAQLRHMDLRKIADQTMRNIHALTGETTFLCVRHGIRAVCIDRVDGDRVNSRVLQLGTSLPLHVGAAPRALLAFEGRRAWETYATNLGFEGHNWSKGPSRAELFQNLDEDRSKGFCLVDNEITPGIAAVGAPIYNHRGEVVASLSMSGLREGILQDNNDGQSAVELILQGSAEISKALGATILKDNGGNKTLPLPTPVSSVV